MDLPDTNEDLLFHAAVPEYHFYKCAEIYDETRDSRKKWSRTPSSHNSRSSSRCSSRDQSRKSSRICSPSGHTKMELKEFKDSSRSSQCSSKSSRACSRGSSISVEDSCNEFDPLTPVGSPKCRSARVHHQQTLNKDSANYTMASLLNYIESIGELQNTLDEEDNSYAEEYFDNPDDKMESRNIKDLNIAHQIGYKPNNRDCPVGDKFLVQPVHSGYQSPENFRRHSRHSSVDSEEGQSTCSSTASSSSFIGNLFSRLKLSRNSGQEQNHPTPGSLPQDVCESSTLSFTNQKLGGARQISNTSEKPKAEITELKVKYSNSTITDSQEEISTFSNCESALQSENESKFNEEFPLKEEENPEESLNSLAQDVRIMRKWSTIKCFLGASNCYDMMPSSSRLVVLDTRLNVRQAFFILVNNGIRAAPLWSTREQRFVGMFTVSDFIKVIYKRYTNPHGVIRDLEKHSISQWRKWLKENRAPFVFVEPNMTLLESLKTLLSTHIHRIPILDPESGNILHSFTYLRLLNHLYNHFNEIEMPTCMTMSLHDLPLGTYEEDGMCKVRDDTLLVEVLSIFVSKNVSAIPVVDEKNRLVNIYAKYDAINLAATKSYDNLGITVTEALQYKQNKFSDALTCHKTDTLEQIVKKIVENQVHRLIIVDIGFCVEGIIALSDLLQFLIN